MYIEPSNLSDLLKQIRIERGLSLREFSETLGISHAYLNKLERGEDSRTGKPITPTIETLVKISEGLRIPTRKFMSMCGYFESSLKANEPYLSESINIDTEISTIITQITPETIVTVGKARISETGKERLREDLRQVLIRLRSDYDIGL